MSGIPPHLMQQGIVASGGMAGRGMSRFGAGVVRQPLPTMAAQPPINMAHLATVSQFASIAPLPTAFNPAMSQMMQGFPQGGMAGARMGMMQMPQGFPQGFQQGGMVGMAMQNMGMNPQGMMQMPQGFPQSGMAMQGMGMSHPQEYPPQREQSQSPMFNPIQDAMGGIVGDAGIKAGMNWLGGKSAGEAFEGFKKDVKRGSIDQTSSALAERFGLDEEQVDNLEDMMRKKFLGLKEKKPSASKEEKSSTTSDAVGEAAGTAVKMGAGTIAKVAVGAAVGAAGGSAAAAAGAGVLAAAAVSTAAGNSDASDAIKDAVKEQAEKLLTTKKEKQD